MGNRTIEPIFIEDPEDPRVAAYRDIRERDLTGRQGLFIAEGEVVVRGLASSASRCRPRSLLLAEKRVSALDDVIRALPAHAPVDVARQAVLDRIAGFELHRGILALGEKPASPSVQSLLSDVVGDDVFVVASGIGNHDNMGGLFRNAAARGVETREGMRVTEVALDAANGSRVMAEDAEGNARTWRARFVVDASGRVAGTLVQP